MSTNDVIWTSNLLSRRRREENSGSVDCLSAFLRLRRASSDVACHVSQRYERCARPRQPSAVAFGGLRPPAAFGGLPRHLSALFVTLRRWSKRSFFHPGSRRQEHDAFDALARDTTRRLCGHDASSGVARPPARQRRARCIAHTRDHERCGRRSAGCSVAPEPRPLVSARRQLGAGVCLGAARVCVRSAAHSEADHAKHTPKHAAQRPPQQQQHN